MRSLLRSAGLLLFLLLPTPGYATAPQTSGLPAFPGAEGSGAMTKGGRGGKVIHVTNLNPSGPGSLQAACQTPGPRIVVFDVSGVIPGDVEITEPFLTIAGQTAPGAGITINGMLSTAYSEEKPVHDVIVRFLRVRARPEGGANGDGVQFSIVDNAILDHLSIAWAIDETVDVYTKATNVTLQWCTLEESATEGHPKGRHNFGLISGENSYPLSVHHNLFAHHSRRNPAFGNGPADFRNNVVYDFRDGLGHEGNYTGKPGFNLIGNYYKRGPSARNPFFFLPEEKIPYYLRDNYIEGIGMIQDPWKEAEKLYSQMEEEARQYAMEYVVTQGVRQERETPMAPVKTHSPQEAYRLVLATAGCFPRDAITRRTIAETKAGTGSWGKKEQPDLLAGLAPGKAPRDTDRDGMPDAWEKRHGLNPKADDSAKVMKSGYTALEEYVNERAQQLIRE